MAIEFAMNLFLHLHAKNLPYPQKVYIFARIISSAYQQNK